jgi:hypothetical protein
LRGDGERLGIKIFLESNQKNFLKIQKMIFSIKLLGARNEDDDTSFFICIGGSRTKQK